mgnify:CR=1 FL=1
MHNAGNLLPFLGKSTPTFYFGLQRLQKLLTVLIYLQTIDRVSFLQSGGQGAVYDPAGVNSIHAGFRGRIAGDLAASLQKSTDMEFDISNNVARDASNPVYFYLTIKIVWTRFGYEGANQQGAKDHPLCLAA